MPTVAASAVLQVANYPGGRLWLGPPAEYLRGQWGDRDWRNVPGPFYAAQTDSCWTGRDIAPRHVVYEDEFGSEVVYRQPKNAGEVHLVLTAAWNDPFGAYAADGDEHWTLELVRGWWADRGRLVAWIEGVQRRWSSSGRADERDNAVGYGILPVTWTTGLTRICVTTDFGWTTDGRPGRTRRFLAWTGRRSHRDLPLPERSWDAYGDGTTGRPIATAIQNKAQHSAASPTTPSRTRVTTIATRVAPSLLGAGRCRPAGWSPSSALSESQSDGSRREGGITPAKLQREIVTASDRGSRPRSAAFRPPRVSCSTAAFSETAIAGIPHTVCRRPVRGLLSRLSG